MSLHSLDNFLNSVFDVYTIPSFSSDSSYKKEEYHVTADEKAWTIEMPLPGISKDDLKVNIEDNMLVIEAKSAIKSKFVNPVKKSWYVDESVDVSSISAKLDNGLLTVTLPKTKPTKKSVSVTVS